MRTENAALDSKCVIWATEKKSHCGLADFRLRSLGIAAKRIAKALMSLDLTEITYSTARVSNTSVNTTVDGKKKKKKKGERIKGNKILYARSLDVVVERYVVLRCPPLVTL